MLRRDVDDGTEFVMFTLWESLDAVKAFAGDDYERAVYYPEDDRYLIERDLTTSHYDVIESSPETG
jgi:heme-degrading monooxygenase HmoA